MKPILISIGPFHIYSFGVMVALGTLISIYLMEARAVLDGFPKRDQVFNLVFATLISGFLGARLFYVIQNFDWYRQHPIQILAVWEGGLIFYGGVAAAFLALIIFALTAKLPILKTLDFLAPFVALTHAFSRIGCFLNGCCGGKVCSLPWAVQFPGSTVAVHPTQLYEVAFDFCLFLFLNAKYRKKIFDGQVAALYFMIYSAGRFFIEFFREGQLSYHNILTYNQWESKLIFGLAMIFYFFKSRSVDSEVNK